MIEFQLLVTKNRLMNDIDRICFSWIQEIALYNLWHLTLVLTFQIIVTMIERIPVFMTYASYYSSHSTLYNMIGKIVVINTL